MQSKRPIVILGGMGPQASSNFYKLLIDKSTKDYHVVNNDDYPNIILQSLAVPDFISDRTRQAEAIHQMRQAVSLSKPANPLAISMACNTAHLFVDEIKINDNLNFVSLIDVVADSAKSAGIKKVGLMASPVTIATGLYSDALKKQGIKVVTPAKADQQTTESVIRAVIAGQAGAGEAAKLADISEKLIGRGAEGIILGCTELPLVFNVLAPDYPVFGCLDLLADELLSRYYREYAILGQR